MLAWLLAAPEPRLLVLKFLTLLHATAELSLLYDDFPVQGEEKPVPQPDVALKERSEQSKTNRSGRTLEYMEEREYQVTAEGIAIRTLPDERSPRTGEILREGEKFTAVEAVDGIDNDPRLYLRLPDGRGWVFNDEKIYPGMPSVKLISEIKSEKVQPEVIKKPLIAVVGRPNVGKSTLVNRICDIADVIGGITHDEVNVTHDRTYKPAEHTDDCGNTYLFDTIDAGGLVFEDSLETVTFKNEIKFQIDVALREAAAAIMVVDGNVGVTEDDYKVARYLQETYISRGLRVVLAVAKSRSGKFPAKPETFSSRCLTAAFFANMGCAHGATAANEFKHGGHMVEPDVENASLYNLKKASSVSTMASEGKTSSLSKQRSSLSTAPSEEKPTTPSPLQPRRSLRSCLSSDAEGEWSTKRRVSRVSWDEKVEVEIFDWTEAAMQAVPSEEVDPEMALGLRTTKTLRSRSDSLTSPKSPGNSP
eukprot:symbB.v1.2.018223.t1/scaffold1421.1/size119699/4